MSNLGVGGEYGCVIEDEGHPYSDGEGTLRDMKPEWLILLALLGLVVLSDG